MLASCLTLSTNFFPPSLPPSSLCLYFLSKCPDGQNEHSSDDEDDNKVSSALQATPSTFHPPPHPSVTIVHAHPLCIQCSDVIGICMFGCVPVDRHRVWCVCVCVCVCDMLPLQVVDNWEELTSEEEEKAPPAVMEVEGVKQDASPPKAQEGVEPSPAQRQEPDAPLTSQQSKSTETESESESSSEDSDEEDESLTDQQRAYNKASRRIQVG